MPCYITVHLVQSRLQTHARCNRTQRCPGIPPTSLPRLPCTICYFNYHHSVSSARCGAFVQLLAILHNHLFNSFLQLLAFGRFNLCRHWKSLLRQLLFQGILGRLGTKHECGKYHQHTLNTKRKGATAAVHRMQIIPSISSPSTWSPLSVLSTWLHVWNYNSTFYCTCAIAQYILRELLWLKLFRHDIWSTAWRKLTSYDDDS